MKKQYKFSDKQENANNEIKNISKNRIPVILVLDGITDIGNVGMIFRIADATRIEKIIMYKTGKIFNEKLLLKKSRSTCKYVKYEYCDDIYLIESLKHKYSLILLEKTNTSIDYKKFIPDKPICIIAGSEKLGVSDELMKISEKSVHLPMKGLNTSVNVATATAVILYELLNNFK